MISVLQRQQPVGTEEQATKSALARPRPITSSASAPVNLVFTGTSVAPAVCTASAAITQWQVLGDQIATRSPASTPADASAPAIACTWSWSSP